MKGFLPNLAASRPMFCSLKALNLIRREFRVGPTELQSDSAAQIGNASRKGRLLSLVFNC
jgi:hypothetical protein